MASFDKIQMSILEQVSDLHGLPQGAYNIRIDSRKAARNTTANIDIVSKQDKDGIDIIIRPGTKNESVHIPVIIDKAGLTETVYNDFFIGEDSDVTIVAGCGIHNPGDSMSEHAGVHRFFVGKNARVKYVEKHYGEGEGTGERIMNPSTIVFVKEGGYMEMETVQIKGIDSTYRKTEATLERNSTLIINEKIFTHGRQKATTDFRVELNGEGSHTHVTSRAVSRDDSEQLFISKMYGNAPCTGRTECDAIVMDNGKAKAIPEVAANDPYAELAHEATIGRIAGDQLIKLMTLGLTQEEAEREIIAGFMK